MKEYFSKILAISLAALVFIASSFVIVDTHFCCGKTVDISIFGKADVCDMDMLSCKFENTSTVLTKDSCCYNSREFKSGANFKAKNLISVNFQQFEFIPIFQYPTFNFSKVVAKNINFKNYSPPLITRDILVMVQCFRI